jgi:hypothetical protein
MSNRQRYALSRALLAVSLVLGACASEPPATDSTFDGGASFDGSLQGSDAGGGDDRDASVPAGPALSLLAGTIGVSGDTDGPAGTSRLPGIEGLAEVGSKVFASDGRAHLRVIDVASRVTSTAVDDSGTPIEYFQPTTLAARNDSELYVLQAHRNSYGVLEGGLYLYDIRSGISWPQKQSGLPYGLGNQPPTPLGVDGASAVFIGERILFDQETHQVSDLGARDIWRTSETLVSWILVDGHVYSLHRDPSMVLETDFDAETYRLVAGSEDDYTGPAVDGPLGVAHFSNEVGSAVADGAGHLFVADTHANAIRKVDIATGTVTCKNNTLN